MLKETGIELLADVHAFSGSRKWPQFSKDGSLKMARSGRHYLRTFPEAWRQEDGTAIYPKTEEPEGESKKSK